MTSKFHLDANVEELMKDPSLGEDKLAGIVGMEQEVARQVFEVGILTSMTVDLVSLPM